MAYAPVKEPVGNKGVGNQPGKGVRGAAFSRKAEPEGILKTEVQIGKSILTRVEGPPVKYRNERHAYSPQQLLILAVIRGDIPAARAAINDGASVKQRTLYWIPAPDSPPDNQVFYFSRSETTPLLLAKRMGSPEMIQFLKRNKVR